MTDRPSGAAPSRLVAVLGPTNTGKTHLAVERMLGHASGMIGLPLRLLAREVYDRIVKLRGARAVALVTGEEKIVPPRPHYWVCTVVAMPLSLPVEFLAVDEIQLCADPERGHVFTERLLHARGRSETMFMGAATHEPVGFITGSNSGATTLSQPSFLARSSRLAVPPVAFHSAISGPLSCTAGGASPATTSERSLARVLAVCPAIEVCSHLPPAAVNISPSLAMAAASEPSAH